MIRYRFDRMDRVTDNGIEMRPLRSTPDGVLFQRLDMTDVEVHLTHAQLAVKICSQTWRWDRLYFSPAQTKLRTAGRDRLVSEASEAEQFHAYAKHRFYVRYNELYASGQMKKTDASYLACKPLLQSLVDEDMEAYWASVPKRKKSGVVNGPRYKVPQPRFARTIVKELDQAQGSISAVLPNFGNCGNRVPRLHPEAQKLLNREVCEYANERRPSVGRVTEHVKRRFREENEARRAEDRVQLRIPGKKAITKALKAMDPYPVYARRWGIAAANREFRLSGLGLAEEIPLRRIEIDTWTVDAETLFTTTAVAEMMDPELIRQLPHGRRSVIVAIDVATRCVVGIKVCAEANAREATAVIEQITRDKTAIGHACNAIGNWNQCGAPFEVIHDNGAEFIGPEFETCLSDLRVNRMTGPAGVPFLRGTIERIFRTFTTELMPLITARTFESIRAKGDSKPGDLAALTDDELTMILVLFIVDVYHKRPHRSLFGETPEDCWNRLVSQTDVGVSPPPSPHIRRAVFGLNATSRIGARGVRFAGLDYVCPELQDMRLHSHQRDVPLRIDPMDIGHISVRVGKDWYPARCQQRGFDGIPYADWTRESRKLEAKHGENAQLQQPVVDRALRIIRETDIGSTLRAGLSPHSLTDRDIARGERDMNIGVAFDVEPDPVPVVQEDGLIGEVIEPYAAPGTVVEEPPLALDPAPERPAIPATKRSWKVSDD